jgi:predicted nucleic acid-binding protein
MTTFVDTFVLYAVLNADDDRHLSAKNTWIIFWVDEGVHRSSHHALLVSTHRRLSLVDCVSFEVMRRLHLNTAFCFYPHFAEQGFRVLLE